MKTFFLLITGILLINITSAQKADLFPKIEKLLNASEGEKVTELASEWKIAKQKFTKILISESKEDISSKTTWVTEYKNLDWKGGYELEISEETASDKVSTLDLTFKKLADYWYYPADENDKGEKERTTILKLYFLTKDYDAVKKLVQEFNKPL